MREVELPKHQGPRPGALSLMTPAERGLCLAIIQAERCGRGGHDLEILAGKTNTDSDAKYQLQSRLNLLDDFANPEKKLQREKEKKFTTPRRK